MANFDRYAETAARLIDKFGENFIHRAATGTYDTSTRSRISGTANQTLRGIMTFPKPSRTEAERGIAPIYERLIILDPAPVSGTARKLEIGDRIVPPDGVHWTVMEVTAIAFQQVKLIYKVGVSKK